MVMRIGGVVSGMDTEAIINASLEAERIPIYRAESRIYQEQQRLTAWSTLDSSLTSLNNAARDLLSYSLWQQRSTTSTDEDIVTASAGDSTATGSYEVNVTQLARSHRIASDAQADRDSELGLSGDFTIGGQTVTIEATDSLDNIRDKINSAALDMAADEKVNATIIGNTLVLERDQTGAVDISISDGATGVLGSLGLVEADGSTPKNEIQTAEDLAATVNGIAITATSNTGITDAVDGVTLNLRAEGSATVRVERDKETVRDLFTAFIDAYNQTMEQVEEYSTVELTEEDELDSVGILQQDSLLFTLRSRGRSLITRTDGPTAERPAVLDEAFNNLQKIGIWTNGKNNRLELVDSAALDAALDNNWEEVEDLVRDYDAGVVRGLSKYLDDVLNPIDGPVFNRQQSIENSVDRMNAEIVVMEDSLGRLETQLWEQFAAMEEAMAGMNNQASYLFSSMGVKTTK